MKQTILAMAIMLMTGLTGAFAKNNEGISNEITTSFNKDFVTATNVSWNKQKDFTKATFTMNNQVMFAYYDESGNLIASARNILSEQLPINLMNDLKKGYSNYWISELFEMDKDGQASYYVTLENANETLILKSSSFNGWSTYKKSKKI
ncbi:MAG TPA: hypothetical protein VHZ50_09410 [Puia sp.]|jgi:hypothetical protein|nr:hypothetical protein [Puia sp.]